MTARIINADVLDGLRPLADGSVHCVVTSPPYWGLRDYGTAQWEGGNAACDHKQGRASTSHADGVIDPEHGRARDSVAGSNRCSKCGARRIDAQIGLEATPEEYVAKMVAVFREVRRVLRADGTAWLNLGSSFSQYLKPKDMVPIPWMVAMALQKDGWYLRSDIIWSKPNPMPESVTDRPTKAHEYVFLLAKSARYYYDAEGIKEPASVGDHARNIDCRYMAPGQSEHTGLRKGGLSRGPVPENDHRDKMTEKEQCSGMRNKRSVWTIAAQAFPGAHFATFPEKLVEPCILAGTSARGCCPKCGAGWERTTEPKSMATSSIWRPGCKCDAGDPVPATVLDPFFGSGTVGLVAAKVGRSFIGIDLSAAYCEMARKRIVDACGLLVRGLNVESR